MKHELENMTIGHTKVIAGQSVTRWSATSYEVGTCGKRTVTLSRALDALYEWAIAGDAPRTFMHKNWNGKRDYECTNVVACVARTAPNDDWIECRADWMDQLKSRGAQQLFIEGGVQYFGWL